MSKKIECSELLSYNKFNLNEKSAHIQLDKNRCLECCDKPCLHICPAGLYTLKNKDIQFDYAGCLECGTCRLICSGQGIQSWEYPQGSFGIAYRQG